MWLLLFQENLVEYYKETKRKTTASEKASMGKTNSIYSTHQLIYWIIKTIATDFMMRVIIIVNYDSAIKAVLSWQLSKGAYTARVINKLHWSI